MPGLLRLHHDFLVKRAAHIFVVLAKKYTQSQGCFDVMHAASPLLIALDGDLPPA